jgi:hypothetical protein
MGYVSANASAEMARVARASRRGLEGVFMEDFLEEGSSGCTALALSAALTCADIGAGVLARITVPAGMTPFFMTDRPVEEPRQRHGIAAARAVLEARALPSSPCLSPICCVPVVDPRAGLPGADEAALNIDLPGRRGPHDDRGLQNDPGTGRI